MTALLRQMVATSRDARETTALASCVQAPVTTGRRIAVAGAREGAGASTVAALLATALAHYRADRVLAVETDPMVGSLPLRLGVPTAPALADLARVGIRPRVFDDVRPFLASNRARVWTLAGSGTVPLTLETYRRTIALLGRFFAVTVSDCGGGFIDPLGQAVLSAAHCRILIAPATPDGVIAARRALDRDADGFNRSMIVFTAHSPHQRFDRQLNLAWIPREVLVLTLPYDRHLASGDVINPRLLTRTSHSSALRLAAEALTVARRLS